MSKVGRNDPCPCGSGKKYKKCHGLNAKATALSEVAKIGPLWVKQIVARTLEIAMIEHKPELDSSDRLAQLNWLCATEEALPQETREDHEPIELEEQVLGVDSEMELDAASLEGAHNMTEGGDLKDLSSITPALRGVDLPTSNRRDRKLSSQIKLSLSQSIFEPFVILEVLRGSGFKVQGCFSGKVYQINQADDAAHLEPMEWIYGRLIIFGRRAYLLEGWEKIPFKRRKALKGKVLERSEDESPTLSWLHEHSEWLLETCREQSQWVSQVEEITL